MDARTTDVCKEDFINPHVLEKFLLYISFIHAWLLCVTVSLCLTQELDSSTANFHPIGERKFAYHATYGSQRQITQADIKMILK